MNDFTRTYVVRSSSARSHVVLVCLSNLGVGSVSTVQNSVEFTQF